MNSTDYLMPGYVQQAFSLAYGTIALGQVQLFKKFKNGDKLAGISASFSLLAVEYCVHYHPASSFHFASSKISPLRRSTSLEPYSEKDVGEI